MRMTYQSLEKVKERYPQYILYNIPMSAVYPVTSIPSIYGRCGKGLIRPDTIGLHWYGGHKLSRQFMELIDGNSYSDYDNLLTQVIKKVVGE